jgi:hypothetical protein
MIAQWLADPRLRARSHPEDADMTHLRPASEGREKRADRRDVVLRESGEVAPEAAPGRCR